MRRMQILALMSGLFLSGFVQAKETTCSNSDVPQIAHEGRMLQAMVELWWLRMRLPMRRAPDHVAFTPTADKTYDIRFFKNGCSIANISIPQALLDRFLMKRLGPEI